jgi:hypothetical protein
LVALKKPKGQAIGENRFALVDVGEGMRRARLEGEPEAQAAYYHCVSRIVDRGFVLEAREKVLSGSFAGMKRIVECESSPFA